MQTTFAKWAEWKRRCNIADCDRDTKTVLWRFASTRINRLIWRTCVYLDRDPKQCAIELSGELCWSLFEVFYEDRASRTGKCYKEWIFASVGKMGGDPADAVQRATNQLLNDVVRQYVRMNWPKEDLTSIDDPLYQNDGKEFTLRDTLPVGTKTPLEDIDELENRRIARPFADRFFDEMNRRERVAMIVKGYELPLYCPEAERAAACKKSMLSDARNRLYERLKHRIARDLPQDTAEKGGRLCFYVCEALFGKCITWAENEECCRSIFRLVEERQANGGHG